MQTEADRKVGWVVQKPIPSFRTQSLRTAAGLPPWDPVAVKCVPDLTWVATPFYDSGPKVLWLYS